MNISMDATGRGEQLRWSAVFSMLWMIRETIEPARYAASYAGSWAHRVASMTQFPNVFIAWFSIAALLMLPLIATLALMPRSMWCKRSERPAAIGLAMAAAGYVYMTTLVLRLDAPHVVDSYASSAALLMGQALLVSCWHNSRIVMSYYSDQLPTLDREPDQTWHARGG